VFETGSVLSFPIDWEKKNFIESNPLGVSMYLLLMAREMVDSFLSRDWAISLSDMGVSIAFSLLKKSFCLSRMYWAMFRTVLPRCSMLLMK